MKAFIYLFTILSLCSILRSTAQLAANDAGTTPGALSVSASGAANYSVPLDLPPGIGDVAPSLALTYNSQGGNGLAGWGWNISGLSTITRVASTLHHDGEIDPVDFDDKDRFALDGQRLILVDGTYGRGGSEYRTENYSNDKVVAYGTHTKGPAYGPSYFIVYHADGSKTWYGNTVDSNGDLEWAANRFEDPNKNYIVFTYTHEVECLY